jgi:hypothetical protein
LWEIIPQFPNLKKVRNFEICLREPADIN